MLHCERGGRTAKPPKFLLSALGTISFMGLWAQQSRDDMEIDRLGVTEANERAHRALSGIRPSWIEPQGNLLRGGHPQKEA